MPFGKVISQIISERGMNSGTEYEVSELKEKGFRYIGKITLSGSQTPTEVERYDRKNEEILLGVREGNLIKIVRYFDLKLGFNN